MRVMNRQQHSDVAQMQNGSYGEMKEADDIFLWDTIAVSTTAQEYQFFTQPIGSGTAPGKTRQRTNMVAPGALPFGQNALVKAISFHYYPKVIGNTLASRVQAFYNMLEESYIQFQIINREFEFEAPGSIFLPNVSIVNETTSGTTNTVNMSRVGDFVYHGHYILKSPIVLENLVAFKLRWFVDTTALADFAANPLTTLTTTKNDLVQWKLGCTMLKKK